jgi:hypothetical protein
MNEEARQEAERFKWIESERAGRDLGEEAIRQWIARHWSGYVRARVLDHLAGTRLWAELPREEFGILPRAFPESTELVRVIVKQLAAGADNLTVISWAVETSQPMDLVSKILQAIDINQYHGRFRFPNEGADPPVIVQE